jgi:hypothetical protein
VKISATLRTKAKNCGIRDWVKTKQCPLTDYYTSIDGLREILRRHDDPENPTDPDWEALAPQVARLLDRQDLLLAYVAKHHKDTDDEQEWAQILLAAAYVILEKYEKALKEDSWPPK